MHRASAMAVESTRPDGGVAIEHDGAGRFSTMADRTAAHLDYQREGDILTITHTIVPSAIGGRGIGGRLVRAALDHARSQGLKVHPRCSYADDWMRRHPEYEDLRA